MTGRRCLLVLLLAGCAGLEPTDRGDFDDFDGGGPLADAGREGGDPGGAGDALPAAEETPPYRDAEDLDPDASAAPGLACFVTDAEPAPYECDGALLSRCPDLRSCCVDDGDCCSPVPGPLPDDVLSFASCATGEAAPCLTGGGIEVTAFGVPAPRVQEGAILPNGDADFDSGLVIGGPLDLTSHRVELGVTFARPATCSATCLEGVGVGFTAQAALGDTSHVQLAVGLLYSGSRNDVSLVVGDGIARSWTLEGDSELWTLVVRPDGRVDVERGEGGVPVLASVVVPPPSARLVVYGRNENRPASAALGARVTGLALSVAVCDMPRAWPTREPLALADGAGPWEPSFAHGPTIAHDDAGRSLVAFTYQGSILVARPQDGGAVTDLRLLLSRDTSIVAPPAGGALRDPELVWTGSGWALFYTVEDGAETSIGRADADALGTAWTAREGFEIEVGDDLEVIEQPTVAVHHSGTWVMAARVTATDGSRRLALYRATGGEGWSLSTTGHLGAITRRGDVSVSGFDADEIASPSLLIHGGAWQLYYAGRRGTRWTVGLLVSDELLRWRSIGAVLAGDGNGFDRVGAGAPDAAWRDGVLEIFYEGHDGARVRLGRAHRQAPRLGTRLR